MEYKFYNNLLKPSSLDNFEQSLDKSGGYYFNSLLNILEENSIGYKVVEGFNYQSDDKDIKEFNKITIEFNDIKKINNICKDYSLHEVFNIKQNKKTFTFTLIA